MTGASVNASPIVTGSTHWPRWSSQFAFAMVVVGVGLRARELVYNRSLWRDEASLVFNLRDRGVLGFTEPLDHDQGTPAGFFVLAQTFGRWLGGSETAYRAIPFLASCIALAVLAVLARRHLSPVTGLVTIGVLAASTTLVYYAAEVKQYSLDLAMTALVWLVADEGVRRGWTPVSAAIFGGTGALAILASHPAVFVLPIVGVVVLHDARTDRAVVRRLIGVGSVWGVAVAGSYLGWTRDLNDSEFLRRFWSAGFLPLPPSSVAELEQWGGAARTLFTQLLPNAFVIPAAVMALIGVAWLAAHAKYVLVLLAAPLLLAALASSLELYPAIERSLLFILPASAVSIGAGADAVGRFLGRRDPLYRWLPALLIGAIAATPALMRAVHPPDQEELRPLLAEVAGRERDATVLVTDTAEVAWRYYAERFDLAPRRLVVREFARQDFDAASDALRDLAGEAELWVVDVAFWRPIGELDPALVSALEAGGGHRRSAHHSAGASIYVYDLSGT